MIIGEAMHGAEVTDSSLVSWSHVEEGVALVRMHDTSGYNTLDDDFVHVLSANIDQAVEHADSRVIVLVGASEVFSSGASKKLLRDLVRGDMMPEDIRLPQHLLSVPLPMIAAMEGHAVGGGLALGLCADVVIAARESRYGCNFMDLGLTPGMGTTRLLEHCMSPAMATELLFSGELRRGSEFAGRAFNYVLPRARVQTAAIDLATRIAEKSRLALETLKRGMASRRLQAFCESFALETAMHRTVLSEAAVRSSIEEEYVSGLS